MSSTKSSPRVSCSIHGDAAPDPPRFGMPFRLPPAVSGGVLPSGGSRRQRRLQRGPTHERRPEAVVSAHVAAGRLHVDRGRAIVVLEPELRVEELRPAAPRAPPPSGVHACRRRSSGRSSGVFVVAFVTLSPQIRIAPRRTRRVIRLPVPGLTRKGRRKDGRQQQYGDDSVAHLLLRLRQPSTCVEHVNGPAATRRPGGVPC